MIDLCDALLTEVNQLCTFFWLSAVPKLLKREKHLLYVNYSNLHITIIGNTTPLFCFCWHINPVKTEDFIIYLWLVQGNFLAILSLCWLHLATWKRKKEIRRKKKRKQKKERNINKTHQLPHQNGLYKKATFFQQEKEIKK